MAKILVADDNSNIQKMVGLALKDHGIEVVAVGNGEAAVRKISDMRPDLVLADVFMPVRNGYEVCQYVKTDSTLAHIPVILLVGAFDPLDEQEAQRVGADGVLKKPFVPPDPLISMVKSALARAGVSLNGERAETPKKAGPTPPPPPPVAEAPTPMNSPTSFGLSPELADQSFVEEVPSRPPLDIAAGSGPLAFGSMLDTEETPDPAFVAPVHSELAPERDWKSSDEEEIEEEESEETPTGSWRRDGGGEAFEDDTRPAAVHDWRDGLAASEASTESSTKHWSPTKEKSATGETAEAPAPAFAGDAWSAAISAGGPETAVAVKEDRVPEYPPEPKTESHTRERSEPVATKESASWLSVPPNPWDAEAQKATQLAATWDAPVVAERRASAPEETQELPQETVEAIRAEASHVAEEAVQQAVVEEAAAPLAPAETAIEAPHAEPSMDEMVAKVLSKLSPEMLQAVTREILKPVIESIVRDEINAKK